MKKYTFLFKPVFFIFNLVFATWLVFQIEKISPSDFGKYRSLFETPPEPIPVKAYSKESLKKICIDYKAGILDSAGLEQQLDRVLATQKGISLK